MVPDPNDRTITTEKMVTLSPSSGTSYPWNTAGNALQLAGVTLGKEERVVVAKTVDAEMRRSDVGKILKNGWFVGVSPKLPRLPEESSEGFEQVQAERAEWKRNELLEKLGRTVVAITTREDELNGIERELAELELMLSSFQIFCSELRNEIDRLVKQRMMSMQFIGEKKWDLHYNGTFHSRRTDEINQLVFRKSGEAVKIRHELRKLREKRDQISASLVSQS